LPRLAEIKPASASNAPQRSERSLPDLKATRQISRDLIGRLAERDLIGTGPREPRRGAPYTFVTTDTFLAAFGIETLRELPDPEQLADAGLSVPE
jgi:chromosome segregation and condensation protein ScpB